MITGFKISMDVRVVDTVSRQVLLPTEQYICVVQPTPYYTHRKNIMAIEVEAMAKIKFMNDMYARLGSGERDAKRQLSGRDWTIEAVVTEQVAIEPVAA